MVNTVDLASARPATSRNMRASEDQLREKAKELEASFLSEMLKYSGVGKPLDSFGGGVGEEQFASFLCDEYGRAMAESGGVGLAESIFHSLQKGAEND